MVLPTGWPRSRAIQRAAATAAIRRRFEHDDPALLRGHRREDGEGRGTRVVLPEPGGA